MHQGLATFLTVMCSYQQNIEPTNTFEQSALFIKGCSCAKRGRRQQQSTSYLSSQTD